MVVVPVWLLMCVMLFLCVSPNNSVLARFFAVLMLILYVAKLINESLLISFFYFCVMIECYYTLVVVIRAIKTE